MTEDNNSNYWCAAKELCICKTAAATTRHLCPVCQGCVHAICGEICEDATILYHTTCYKRFAHYKKSFENPQSFRYFIAGVEKDDIHVDEEDDERIALPSILDNEVVVEEVAPVAGHVDSAIMRVDKIKKRREFIKKLTLAQCEIENCAADDGLHYVKLVSVGGILLTKLLLSDLQLFCATHKISGYRQKKKEDVSQLIAARVASDNIYASIGRLGMTQVTGRGTDEIPAGGSSKPQNYRSKMIRPKAVTKTGSYFRIINLWFSAQNRHLVLLTGKKMNRAELDVGGYRHKTIWDNLAEQYNKNTGMSNCIHGDNAYLDVIQTPHMLYDLENPEDFDELEGRDIAQFVRYITHQYYVTYKSVSGNHARFEDRVGEKSYLLYFHNMITATGAENLESLMKAELSADVFSESLVPGSVSDETAVTPATKKHQFNRNKRKGPPSSTKEQTDNAILRYISRNEHRDSTGGSLTSSRSGFSTSSTAKDDYIREKKRMAVEIFDIAMAKEITDAVDTSLKKWKASLLEVRELTEDGITGTDHPLYIATKAAADLHESTFHSCLARANARAQQGQEERFAVTTRNEESKAEDADDVEDSIEDIVDDPYDDDLSVNKDNFNDVS